MLQKNFLFVDIAREVWYHVSRMRGTRYPHYDYTGIGRNKRMEKTKIGVVGLGGRGFGLTKVVAAMEDVEIVAVCDVYEDRVRRTVDGVREIAGYEPRGLTNHHDLLNIDEIKGVLVPTSWISHIPVALDCMRAGKLSASEVGGAYAVDDCWELIRTYEATHTPAMLLENCNYGRDELMVLNMVRKGIFGEVVHCQGGYRHDLRFGLAHNREPDREMRHYRQAEYLYRNCDNYPTHDLGPIAKILDINRGNRMLTLTSTASCARGLHDHIARTDGPEYPLANRTWNQGDIVTTVIKCANGETISLVLDTTLPRPYSRNFQVHGTRAVFTEDNHSLFIEGEADHEKPWKEYWGNVESYYEKYDHPIWKGYDPNKGGHGGMDYLVLRGFIDAVRQGSEPPIDVYDMAAWMSVTPLSEESIALGGHPVAVPDFTRGKWFRKREVYHGEYEL